MTAKSKGRRSLALTELDHRVLVLLADHRVLTTKQLLVATDAPERTLHHRLSRMRGAGLVDRARPYADVGSAPGHHFLTTRGAALVGDPAPRRPVRTPSPLFLEHTVAVADLWLALSRHGAGVGLVLRSWAREEAAWEDWSAHTERGHICPDAAASVEVGGVPVDVMIEVDRATMVTRRLVVKANRYRAYAVMGGWRGVHDHCPVVLLATTSERRANGFLKRAGDDRMLPKHVRQRSRWRDYTKEDERLVVAAAGCVEDPHAAVTAPVWRMEAGEEPWTLTELLGRVAQRNRANEHNAAVAAAEAAEAKRTRALLDDLDHLRRHDAAIAAALTEAVSDTRPGDALVELLDTLHQADRNRSAEEATPHTDLLAALAAWWRASTQGKPPLRAVASLTTDFYPPYYDRQVARVLSARDHAAGTDPGAAVIARRLAAGRLVSRFDLMVLDRTPHRCDPGKGCVTEDYQAGRDFRVARRWRELSRRERRATSPEALAASIDAAELVVCDTCGHALLRYPDHHRREDRSGRRCALCPGRLVPWEERPLAPPPLAETLADLARRRCAEPRDGPPPPH